MPIHLLFPYLCCQAAYAEWANFQLWHSLLKTHPSIGPPTPSKDTSGTRSSAAKLYSSTSQVHSASGNAGTSTRMASATEKASTSTSLAPACRKTRAWVTPPPMSSGKDSSDDSDSIRDQREPSKKRKYVAAKEGEDMPPSGTTLASTAKKPEATMHPDHQGQTFTGEVLNSNY